MNNIKRIALTTCTAAAIAVISALPAAAGSIVVERAWAETEDSGADLFAIVKNTGTKKDVLYAVKTKIAREAKLEALSEADDRAGRNQTVLKFDIGPGQTLELTEDGPHVELKRMRRKMKDGDKFQVTFYFENAGPVFVDATIEDD